MSDSHVLSVARGAWSCTLCNVARTTAAGRTAVAPVPHQIIQVLGLSPATVSKHMNILEQAGLVTRTRQGKWRFYKLADESQSRAVKRALEWVLAELRNDPRVTEDARNIRKVRRQDLEELSACYRS